MRSVIEHHLALFAIIVAVIAVLIIGGMPDYEERATVGATKLDPNQIVWITPIGGGKMIKVRYGNLSRYGYVEDPSKEWRGR